MVQCLHKEEVINMKLNQTVVAVLVEEADASVSCMPSGDLVTWRDVVAEQAQDELDLSSMEDEVVVNYGYGADVVVSLVERTGGRYWLLHCTDVVTGLAWVAFYSYVREEVKDVMSMEEYAEMVKNRKA